MSLFGNNLFRLLLIQSNLDSVMWCAMSETNLRVVHDLLVIQVGKGIEAIHMQYLLRTIHTISTI